MAEYARYSETNPQWQKFVSSRPEIDSSTNVSLSDRRQILDDIAALGPARKLPESVDESVDVQTFTIKARDGYDIPVRSYCVPSPSSQVNTRPLLVYFHGGAFVFGDLESGDTNCRVLAATCGINVLNVDYRLAPKWPFPYGVNDSYDAVSWAAAHAEGRLQVSLSDGFLVGGISSGANFAAVIAYTARDEKLLPPITGLFISIPVGLLPQAYEKGPLEWKHHLLSLNQNSEGPLLTKKLLNLIEDIYKSPPSDTRVSFLLNEDHSGLPTRLYLQICGSDPLRDEAFLWQKLLQKSSLTKSKVDLYTGLPHGFWRFTQMRASQEWLSDLVDGIKFLTRSSSEHELSREVEVAIKGI